MTKPYKPKFKKSPFNHVKYTLVRNQDQLNQALKGRYELTFMDMSGCAQVSTIHVEKDWSFSILQIGDTSNWAPNFIMETLLHESVHIWQDIRERMSESKPSTEFEAYSIQTIFRDVLDMYDRSQAK